jgi:predicted nuclease with TOPRIM domain
MSDKEISDVSKLLMEILQRVTRVEEKLDDYKDLKTKVDNIDNKVVIIENNQISKAEKYKAKIAFFGTIITTIGLIVVALINLL